MHGRGSQGRAPASDAATREGRRRPRVGAASCRVPPRGIYRFGPTRADAAQFSADTAEIGAAAAEIGPTRPVSAETAESGRNSKKKKKKRCKRTVYKLLVKYLFINISKIFVYKYLVKYLFINIYICL